MRRRSAASSPAASVVQPGMTVSSSPSKPSAAQWATATSIGTRGIPQVLCESRITKLAGLIRRGYEPEMLVDLPLIGVDGARLDLGDGHRPPGDLRFEEGVDEGDIAQPHLPIDFGMGPSANAPRQLVIFERDQLAIGSGKVEVIHPGALAA